MRRTIVAGGLAAVFTVAGCGHRAVEISPNAQPIGKRWNATLATPAGLAGAIQVAGSGWMGSDPKDPQQTLAHVEIMNAAPGGRHPWHIHRGQCGADEGVLGPADAYSVLKVGGDGKADGDAKLPMPLPAACQYFVNVHASAGNMGTIVACGNLAPPAQ